MATQADIPSDLTDNDKASALQYLDAILNSGILYSFLHGIYTGILAVTLWNIFINKYFPIHRAVVIMIILLYALITISCAVNWTYIRYAFIESGQSFWTVYLRLNNLTPAFLWESGVPAFMSTVIADLYMIWCCWMVWERRWPVVLLPILSQISATVSKIMEIYHDYSNTADEIFSTLYISFVLATTLWCTVLIIYRILTVTGVRPGADGRLRVYHRFIAVLVESSALYSMSLIVFLAFIIRDGYGLFYLDSIAGIAKGIAPTLLVGRAAAGHTRPKDDCDESAVSTLHFQTPSEPGTTRFRESTMQSAVPEMDIEAQQGQSHELIEVVERT